MTRERTKAPARGEHVVWAMRKNGCRVVSRDVMVGIPTPSATLDFVICTVLRLPDGGVVAVDEHGERRAFLLDMEGKR